MATETSQSTLRPASHEALAGATGYISEAHRNPRPKALDLFCGAGSASIWESIVIGVYGEGCRDSLWKYDKGVDDFTMQDGHAAMGIDWMTLAELYQAIPPAYSEFLCRQLFRSGAVAPAPLEYNVRHERWTKGREAAFGTSARWRG